MKTAELRKKFLEFFQNKGHKIFPSDTLVPDDPTVFFTSAGMNQFKPYFLGEKKDVRRAASCQKCLRTGDLEEVGKTPFHHTFFEMLGNFSFGDYFKKEAIEFAWDFLLKNLNIPEINLWVSVYKDDDEAFDIWSRHIGINTGKIIRLGEDKNFWPANAPLLGPNGTCGPCSEIFFDKGENRGCGRKECSPACGCGRFVEIWNLVFTQFNRTGENLLEPLPQKNIDTGMGLERAACVLQDKESNFEIDILHPVVMFVEDILKAGIANKRNIIYAIVDHSRAVTFAISDGVYPSNEDRGYVVRKLIRKALGSAYILGIAKPFIYRLPAKFGELMKDTYPEIDSKNENISKVILAEEERFLTTLREGRSQFFTIVENIKKDAKSVIDASDLFRLYDTYGFPLELSKVMAKETCLDVDEQGFSSYLKQQQEASRKKSMFDETIFKKGDFSFEEFTEFSGYEKEETTSTVLRLLKNKEDKDSLEEGDEGIIILDKTPFYPESGGQLTDTGIIQQDNGEFEVIKVLKVDSAIIHQGKVKRGRILKGKTCALIDRERRRGFMRAHTATHLLQSALRKILGEHIAQQGSLVDEDRLRFDFTQLTALSSEELKRVEDFVNELILGSHQVKTELLPYDAAKKEGALAFFKDKYQNQVRVVSVKEYSKELCGGTHLSNTSLLGTFLIISESSISSGIRRIEALVGKEAYKYFREMRKNMERSCKLLKIEPHNLEDNLVRLLNDLKDGNDKISKLEKKILEFEIIDIVKAKKEVEGVNFLICNLPDKDYSLLRYAADRLKGKSSSLFIFFTSSYGGKNIFLCTVTDDLINKGIVCNKFISLSQEKLHFKGGGNEKLVQGVITKKIDNFFVFAEDCFREFLVTTRIAVNKKNTNCRE